MFALPFTLLIASNLLGSLPQSQGSTLPTVPPANTNDDLLNSSREAGLTANDVGSFLTFRYQKDGKPTSTVYVRKEVYKYESISAREVFGLVYDSPIEPSGELLLRFLMKPFTIGGLQYEAPSEKQKNWRIRFRMEIPINCPGKKFRFYCDTASITCDSLVKEFETNVGGTR